MRYKEGTHEWTHGATSSADKKGDDDVEILLKADGTVQVAYRQ